MCKFKCYLNPWITHWALALVKLNREPHEAKKKSFDLGGNPPRAKDFFFASYGSLFPFARANAQWVIHGFKSALKFTHQGPVVQNLD